jgi:hypothetical protein
VASIDLSRPLAGAVLVEQVADVGQPRVSALRLGIGELLGRDRRRYGRCQGEVGDREAIADQVAARFELNLETLASLTVPAPTEFHASDLGHPLLALIPEAEDEPGVLAEMEAVAVADLPWAHLPSKCANFSDFEAIRVLYDDRREGEVPPPAPTSSSLSTRSDSRPARITGRTGVRLRRQASSCSPASTRRPTVAMAQDVRFEGRRCPGMRRRHQVPGLGRGAVIHGGGPKALSRSIGLGD